MALRHAANRQPPNMRYAWDARDGVRDIRLGLQGLNRRSEDWDEGFHPLRSRRSTAPQRGASAANLAKLMRPAQGQAASSLQVTLRASHVVLCSTATSSSLAAAIMLPTRAACRQDAGKAA